MADTYTLVTKTGTSTGAGTGLATGGAKGALVHAYSATTSTSSILIQGSVDNLVWKTLATITNVDASPDGTAYIGNAWPYMRANVAAHSGGGTIVVTLTTLDYAPGYWNVVTRAVDAAGALTVTNLTDSGLTATRVPFAGTGGLLQDAAAFTYAAGTLDVTAIRPSGLTATRVPFAGVAGLIGDSPAFTHVAGLTASTIFQGGFKNTITAKLIDGAIASAPGTIVITKATPLGSSVLATPTVTDHDGYELTVVSSTAQAHVFTFASGKVNGGSLATATFGAQIGNYIKMVAYQGVWYVVGNVGVTLS